nr:helix-turn-helix transcriptional regulator [Actinomycetales bacterium]
MTTERLVRADAARNRERILDTARAQITARGPDASIDEIAEAAGVAVGTLYRHFPTKTYLVAAVVGEQIEKLAALIERSLARVESGAAEADHELLQLLRTVLDGAANNRALRAAALTLPAAPGAAPTTPTAPTTPAAPTTPTTPATPAAPEPPAGRREPAYSQPAMRAFAALDQLIQAGHTASRLRPGLTANDVVLLACTGPFDHPAEARERWLELLRPGLLTQGERSSSEMGA